MRVLGAILSLATLSLFLLSVSAMGAPPQLEIQTPYEVLPAIGDDGYNALAESKGLANEVYAYGGPGNLEGRFESEFLTPDPQGWVDQSELLDLYWHVGTFNAELLDPAQVDNQAMWCGDYFPPCDGELENPGYGNSWDQFLDWYADVPDPLSPTTITLSARLNYDLEENYDYLYLDVVQPEGIRDILSFTGKNMTGGVFVPVDVDQLITIQPEEYVGVDSDRIHLRWRVTTDSGWSDEDCQWVTDGAAQVDNIAVEAEQGGAPFASTYDDFELGSPVAWTASQGCPTGRIWAQLDDAGLCPGNSTPQIAFVNDGTACQGGPGSVGVDWTYGPGGYTVRCDSSAESFSNAMASPPIVLPANWEQYDGAHLEYDVYLHKVTNNNGPFDFFQIRSSLDGGASWEGWESVGFWLDTVALPDYRRHRFEVAQLIPSGATHVQVMLGYITRLLGAQFCDEMSPAPYFDNVALKFFEQDGPSMVRLRLADDAFPASGELDLVDLESNHVPFMRESQPGFPRVEVGVSLPREGSVIAAPMTMHWTLRANPLFDAYRTAMPPNPVMGSLVSSGDDLNGYLFERYQFDLPDSNFLYPGDVLHYYFEASDDVAGDQRTVTLPADLSAYGVFEPDKSAWGTIYDPEFSMEALPSVISTAPGDQPKILLWHGRLERLRPQARPKNYLQWSLALSNLGYVQGRDYDMVHQHIMSPIATASQLAGYEVILYSSGIGSNSRLSSEDASIILSWLAQGQKKLLTSGDNPQVRLQAYAGYAPLVSLFDIWGVRPYIDDQISPNVVSEPGNPVGLTVEPRTNGCLYDTFIQMVPAGTGQRIMEYTGPGGAPADYEVAAAIYNYLSDDDSHVITLGQDMWALGTPYNKNGAGARAQLLGEILSFFGQSGGGPPTSVPERVTFKSWVQPNPFNPRTSIHYRLPEAGPLKVSVYDLRGARVRVIHDGFTAAGEGHVVWDGKDGSGSSVASGLYLVKVEAPRVSASHKVALIR